LPQKSSDNASIDAQIIPTIKDPQIDSAYINQFAKFILPYIQQDYERDDEDFAGAQVTEKQ